MTRANSIGWPGLIGKCWSLTGQFGIMESTPRLLIPPSKIDEENKIKIKEQWNISFCASFRRLRLGRYRVPGYVGQTSV